MKNLILLLMLPLMSFGQLLVDTTPQYKNVILEEFTGIHCMFCPDGHVIAQNIKNVYPNDVFVLNLHTGGYAYPNQGEPDFRVGENDSIAVISNLAGYPAGTVNRKQFPMTQGGGTAMSRGDWLDAASEVLAQESYVNIGMLMQHDSVSNTLIIDVELYYTDSTPVDGFGFSPLNYLNVVLVQDSIAGPQDGASQFNPGAIINGPWQPTYSHQHMVRDYVTGQWGEVMTTGPVGPGHFIFNRYIYSMLNVPFINGIFSDMNHIKAVAFVTEGEYGEIITGTGVDITQPAPPPVGWAEILPNGQHAGVAYDLYGRVVTDIKKNTIYIRNMEKFIQF